MKELELYLLKITQVNPRRTLAYKIGTTQDFAKRDIRNEFLKIKNAMVGLPKIDIEDEPPTLILKGPENFIKELERSILNDYFKDDARYFDTKQEYIQSYEETAQKYSELVKMFQKEEVEVKNITEMMRIVDKYVSGPERDVLMNHFDKEISKLCIVKTPVKAVALQVSSTLHVQNSNTSNQTKVRLKDVLTKDFVLYKKGNKYYLQHKEYHAGKEPTEYRGSVSILDTSEKFQFQGTELMKKYNYDVTCISLKYALKAFAQNIINL